MVTAFISVAVGNDKLTSYLAIGVTVGVAAALISDIEINSEIIPIKVAAPL